MPVIEPEARVTVAGALGGGRGVLRVRQGRGGSHGAEHGLIRVKVDADLEGDGVGAGGGVGRGGGGGAPEVAADPRHAGDFGGGAGGGLERHDLKIVSFRDLGALGGTEGGYPGAHGSHSGCLGGVQGRAADTIRGLGRGGVDVGAVADGAVAPVPSDADVIILVRKMGLRGGNRASRSIPVKTGNRT